MPWPVDPACFRARPPRRPRAGWLAVCTLALAAHTAAARADLAPGPATEAPASASASASEPAPAPASAAASAPDTAPAAEPFIGPLPGDSLILQAREALRRHDRAALAEALQAANALHHPLAMWVDYWELSNRLAEARQGELDAFYARWPGTYVEDRLRNDWLLELGRRRDWADFRVEYPRFVLKDDPQAACYWLLTRHLDGHDVREPALAAWAATRDPDDGCALLGSTLVAAHVFSADDVWHQIRLATEHDRAPAAQAAAALLDKSTARAVADLWAEPQRFLRLRPRLAGRTGHELALLALMRLAATDPDAAAAALARTWHERLPLALTATAWAQIGRASAVQHLPQAAEQDRRAWQLWTAAHRRGVPPPWGDELLAWQVRAALREPAGDRLRWPLALRAIDAMSPAAQQDEAWVYWKARALQALAAADPAGPARERARTGARVALASIGARLSFYGLLANEDLGGSPQLPDPPAAPTREERAAVRRQGGLVRGLELIDLGLRSEGVREWNYTTRTLTERELLAAAQWACERDAWDRCIQASERTRFQVDIGQRYPLPFLAPVLAQAARTGLEPAVLYGLIRQESRFVLGARSSVGAGGLMQIMPGTARWTAKKIGLPFEPAMLADRDINLQLGMAYFKRVLDDFDGSLPLAAAAYNAGPRRARRWRDGSTAIEPAAWAETIPFNETRGYVKQVLANGVVYALRLGQPAPTLKRLLGPPIGPPPPGQNDDADLP
ncbi:MAG: lytic transglycosylase domain-containing protein [Burkholderiales bacterium]|nr:lytic transglycosylase domain-containing protein [Burkholderiales bacterium]